MNLLRKMFGRAEARPLDLRAGADVSIAPAAMDAGVSVSAQNSLTLSAVWGCVGLLSGTLSSLPLQVFKVAEDGARTMLRDHPLYMVLHDSPNADQTALGLWDFITTSIELWGNGYLRRMAPPRKRPLCNLIRGSVC